MAACTPRIGRGRRTRARLLAALLSLWLPAVLAHPHVIFDYALQPVLRDGTLAGLHIEWTMDEAASALALRSLAAEGGALDAERAARFAAGNAALLARRNYLLTLVHAGRALPFDIARPLAVARREARLVLTFEIAFAPLPRGEPLRVRLFDETWYVAFAAAPPPAASCAQRPVEERLPTQGWGEQTVAAVEIDCSGGGAVAQTAAAG
ncbi:MAG: DUF1007 family protein [Burkholderiaceae bacterium]|nr:DUF1007 family protein [Burkholderiaceae bacterium]MCX8003542.1 DUF1007 family protein [Burkholderiaceae bacterium]